MVNIQAGKAKQNHIKMTRCACQKGIQECSSHRKAAPTEQKDELSAGQCGMAVWRYQKLFQISGFQKELESATQCCRQNVSSWNNP